MHSNNINTKPTVRFFAPEHWGEVDVFCKFYRNTYQLKPHNQKELSGISSHFEKANILNSLANKLAINLNIDENELHQNGFTPAKNSRELSAVIESIFIELYSSIDCTCKVIKAIYGYVRGLPDSTRKMFDKMQSNEISFEKFPNELKKIFQEALWYKELLYLRDELTHASTGSCHKEGTLVKYIHYGIRIQNEPLICYDIFHKIRELIHSINIFLGAIFRYLNTTLEKAPIEIICGIFYGRAYSRQVEYTYSLNFNSGSCQSKEWFDLPENKDFKCPFVNECGAYKNG